jgi:hypothetical protein
MVTGRAPASAMIGRFESLAPPKSRAIDHPTTPPSTIVGTSVTGFEIAMAKVWANGLVITTAVALSLYGVVRTLLGVPIAGSIPLFMI